MNQAAKKVPVAKGRIELNENDLRVLVRIGRITKGQPDVWVKPGHPVEHAICERLRFKGLLIGNLVDGDSITGYRVSPLAEDLAIFDGWRSLDMGQTTTRAGVALRTDPDGLSIRFPVDYQGATPKTGGLEGEVMVGPDGLVSMRVRADYEGAVWYPPSEEHGEPMRLMNAAIRALAQAAATFWNEVDG